MMKIFIIFFTLIFYTQTFSEEKVFSIKTATNLYMKPDISSPVIYPVDHGKELITNKKQGNWINVLDQQTGLVGWVLEDDFSESKPEKKNKIKKL
jgi:uncharacterized protein YgiM (DUF1202 family)